MSIKLIWLSISWLKFWLGILLLLNRLHVCVSWVVIPTRDSKFLLTFFMKKMSAFQGNVIKTMHISGILESNIRRFRTSNISIFCRVNECHCCIKCTRYLCKALKIAKKVLNLRGVSISFRSILFNYFAIYYKLTILVL